MTALPLSRKFQQLAPDSDVVLVTPDGASIRKRIRNIRPVARGYGISFQEIETPEQALAFRGALITAPKDSLAMDDGEYWCDDIIGLSVVTTEGSAVGAVTEVISTGGNDVYVVENLEKEYLIPAIRDVIVEISIPDGRIVIKVMEGMLD